MSAPTYALIVTLYTALGGPFDRAPQTIATFDTMTDCRSEAARVEGKSGAGNTFIATCLPVAPKTQASRCNEHPFSCGVAAFFGQRL